MSSAELIDYFTAEKNGGILLACLGLASLGLALFLVVNRSSFVAMAWPLVIVGVFQLVVGVTVAARTPRVRAPRLRAGGTRAQASARRDQRY